MTTEYFSASGSGESSTEDLIALAEKQRESGNLHSAFKYYKRAANRGDGYAAWCVGEAYLNGEGVKQSQQLALKHLRFAAKVGQPEAMTSLGHYYAGSENATPNYRLAIKWYRRAAEYGEPHALHNLGVCYSAGQGVRKNEYRAFMYFSSAALFGHIESQFKVGWCYLNSTGAPFSLDEARFWLKASASGGSCDARNELKNLRKEPRREEHGKPEPEPGDT